VDNFQKLQMQRKTASNKGLADKAVAENLIKSVFHGIATCNPFFSSDFRVLKNRVFSSTPAINTLQKPFETSIFTFNPAAHPPALPL
jgi:hypothetical protein